jgi:large subunit ribosomal protein L19
MANTIKHAGVTFNVGDTVRVHQNIKEAEDKTRIQIFEGVVIAIKAAGDPTFIVRKIAAGSIGVEKIFPIHAPVIAKIEVKKQGAARRAKLYYLRDRIGRSATKVKDVKKV